MGADWVGYSFQDDTGLRCGDVAMAFVRVASISIFLFVDALEQIFCCSLREGAFCLQMMEIADSQR